MKDVLYIVGQDAAESRDLRWSLRSLAKYVRNVGRVIVAGYPPAWLSDEVVKFPCEDLPDAHYKHTNILNVILKAIDAGVLTGEFVYSSDDHFQTVESDIDFLPYYFKRERIRSKKDLAELGIVADAYKTSVANTGALLEAAGLEPVEWSGHVNTHMHAADAPRVKELLNLAHELSLDTLGFEPTCLFMACRDARDPVGRCKRKDKKFDKFNVEMRAQPFSTYDYAVNDPEYVAFMEAEFGEPCRYEMPPKRICYVYATTAGEYERQARFSMETLKNHVQGADVKYYPVQDKIDSYFFRLDIPLMNDFEGYDRVIWVDADTCVVSDKFAEIETLDVGPNGVGAVRDPLEKSCREKIWRTTSEADRLGIGYAGRFYANDGVIAFEMADIDKEAWRMRREQGLALWEKYQFPLRDQDVLHLMWPLCELPELFNMFWGRLASAPDPYLIHYTGPASLGGSEAKRQFMEMVNNR